MTRQRTLAAACAFSFLIWGMVGLAIGALLPAAVSTFSLSPIQGGMIFVVWSLGFSVGSLAAQRLLNVVGAARLLLAASACAGLSCWLQSHAQSYATFLTVFTGLGSFGGVVFTASHTLFGGLFRRRRPSALAVLDLVFSFGNMSAPLVILAIARSDRPWQSFFGWTGCGFALAAVLFATAAAGRSTQSPTSPAADPDPVSEQPPGQAPRFVLLSLASFGLGATEWSQNVWFVTSALDRGLSPATADIALSLFTAGMILSRFSTIALGERRPPDGFIIVLLSLSGLGDAITASASTAGLIVAGNILLGAGLGAIFPVFLARAIDRSPGSAATCSTIMVVSLTLGGQAASLILGAAIARVGMSSAFALVMVFAALMIAGFEGYRRATADTWRRPSSNGP